MRARIGAVRVRRETVVTDELWRKSAGELAGLIAKGEVSSVEVVTAHLERIAQVNPALNAVTVVLADSALAGAAEADQRTATGGALGPFHGVPFTIKENIDVAGSATTQGVHALAEAIPGIDAPIVQRMRAAGAIPIGRTNLPDFGLRVHTDSSLRGLTRNPWNPLVTTGGSSGGEGAALAAGMTPVGLGNDIGGSLRNPAHCCGIASIKPTSGRLPAATVIPPEDEVLAGQLMATDGPMARTVADVRTAFRILAGPDVRDPFVPPVPLDLPRPDGPIRVALLADPPGAATDPGIIAVVRAAGDTLADAGYDVVEATPPRFTDAFELWGRWLGTELAVQQPVLDLVMGEGGLRFLALVQDSLAPTDLAGLVVTLTERHAVARAWAVFQAEHPLLVLPVWNQPAFPHGWDIESAANAAATLDIVRPVVPANLLGLPAAVVPGGMAGGLPVGVQVVGDRWREDLVLDAAETIERAVGVLTPIDPVVA